MEGNILVSGSNGVIINAGDDDVVILRNLQFEGLDTSLAAVKIVNAVPCISKTAASRTSSRESSKPPPPPPAPRFSAPVPPCWKTPASEAAAWASRWRIAVAPCSAICTIALNVADGLKKIGKDVIQSFKNNRIVGNTPDGKATLLPMK
jgi:hypothetical protein